MNGVSRPAEEICVQVSGVFVPRYLSAILLFGGVLGPVCSQTRETGDRNLNAVLWNVTWCMEAL